MLKFKYSLFIKTLLLLVPGTLLCQKYSGGSFDGNASISSTTIYLDGFEYSPNLKYHGGSYDGNSSISSTTMYLSGFEYSPDLKYRGGNYDGSDVIISTTIYLNGVVYSPDFKYHGGNSDGFASAISMTDIGLPVFLSLFEISEERGQVALSWKTASEVNNLYWLVQRKDVEADNSPGNDFETIAQIDGKGTTSNESAYTLADNSTISGREYAYRLVDVSFSGRKHFHDVQSIFVGLPSTYKLFQNYPNPFNPTTNILYDLPLNSEVHVDVYNILGQKVATLVNKNQDAGYYKLVWNSLNERGSRLASGMYILAIQASGEKQGKKKSFSKARKMMLVK